VNLKAKELGRYMALEKIAVKLDSPSGMSSGGSTQAGGGFLSSIGQGLSSMLSRPSFSEQAKSLGAKAKASRGGTAATWGNNPGTVTGIGAGQ